MSLPYHDYYMTTRSQIGQRIRKVEEGSAAEQAGLKGGDRIICVNGTNVERDSHKEVVDRIRENSNETRMLVVDEETDKYLQVLCYVLTIPLGFKCLTENSVCVSP